MKLPDISIKRPVFATMMILSLVLLGVVSYPSIGVDLFPKVDFPIISLTTMLPGASPEVIDIDVTDKIEESINTINGVKSITSISTEGVSTIIVEFVLDRNIDLAAQDVREKISAIRAALPRDIYEPVVAKVDMDSAPVLWLALTGKKSVREISTYANETLKEALQKIPGVGAIQTTGLRLRQVRIWLDKERLKAYSLTGSDVVNALRAGNIELPGGRIESTTKEFTVKIKGEFTSPEEFNNLIITYKDGKAVRLKDVGRALDDMAESRSIARFNGETAIGLGIQKQSGTNTADVVDRVKKELETIEKTLPPGLSIGVSFDQSIFIKRSINEVMHHLIYGGIFASIAVLIFLGSMRVTLISALAIPTSIVSTFAMMHFLDFTFNNMSMLALSLSIGILVDDAIIVIENIHRHMKLGMPPKEAASFGTDEIGLAVMATTLAIVAIFLPVAFMKGLVGRFFVQFALTVVFAVLMSMFVSFTLTPMLASRFLKAEADSDSSKKPSGYKRFYYWFNSHYLKLEGVYRGLLKYSLEHRLKILAFGFAIFVFSIFMVRFIGKEMLPPEDQARFIVRLQAPVDYSVSEVDNMFRKAEDIIRAQAGVQTVFYALGFGQTGEINKASVFITLTNKRERSKSQEKIKSEVRKLLKSQVPGLKATVEDVSIVGGGQRNTPIQYNIRGPDLSALEGYSKDIMEKFSKIPGIVDVDTSMEPGKPEVRVYVDRDRAADLGIDIATIAEAINLLIGGEVDVSKYKDTVRGRRYDVRVRLNPEDRTKSGDIGGIYVRAKDGRLIELSTVVTTVEAGGPSVINRVDRQRAVLLFANLEKKPLGEAMGDLRGIAEGILPQGYSGIFKGMGDTMGESFYYLTFAIFLGIFMAYMILAAQFESFIHPVTVLLAMPFSFIGAFGALLITGMTLNIFSFIGLILLMGLVKKNSILLVNYTNTLRARGMSRREALIEAGPVRLRPILMTTFAMIFGMMPIALALGDGSETRAPMAVATIGGLITSLFLTLLVVPSAYDLFDDIQMKIMRKGNSKKF
ncbi:MAG: efflux RND transporter permease subunit [Nitrospirae bacterium]|nr:efflux RND transporter permease subunit [Nitrospirota bacterium]MBF0535031.1 efflux RND transporter permease subunit [Nitrospirota bacterium]MBF0616539.1 efflux RND transporter permease subunit [Nitrospirota bacterium]